MNAKIVAHTKKSCRLRLTVLLRVEHVLTLKRADKKRSSPYHWHTDLHYACTCESLTL